MGPLNPGGGATARRATRRCSTCRPAKASEETGVRPDDSVDAGAARLSPAGHRRGHGGADGLLRRGPGRGRLRRRRRAGAAAHPGQPLVPLPHRVRARGGRERRLPHQRPRARLAPVVLPLEQHPRRRAARPGDEEPAARAGGARAADPADAGGPALAGLHRQLRRAVAVAAAAARHRAGSVPLSRLRRHAGAGLPARGGAVLRQHRARRPAGSGPADRQLHVRQRAAGAALRHPERQGHQLPARDAGRRQPAARPARQGRDSHRDGVPEPHLAGRARQVGAAERARRAAARAAARRARACRRTATR